MAALFTRAIARVTAIVCLLVTALSLSLARVGPAQAAGLVTDCTEQGLANAMNSGSGLITFDCGPSPVVIPWTVNQNGLNVGPNPYVCAACTIDGGNLVTLSGAGVHRLFDVRPNGALTLTNIILSDGFTDVAGNLPDWGGAILDEDNLLVLDHVTIRDSQSLHLGGAVRVVTGTALIQNSLIENNQSGAGGGIDSLGELTLVNSIVRGNQAGGTGGGLQVGGSTVISASQILNNFAHTGSGGGLFVSGGASVNLSGSRLEANRAPGAIVSFGGAIFNSGDILTVTDSSLISNTARYGGGLYTTGQATLTNDTLSHNLATIAGGGLGLGLAPATVSHTTLSGNQAGDYGGGINNSGGTLTVQASTLSGNGANSQGGGIDNDANSLILLSDSTLSGNSAIAGGGLYITFHGSANLNRSTFSGNTAQAGGGLYNAGGVDLTNMTLSGNTADGQGGGIFSTAEEHLTNVTLSGNSSPVGGALYVLGGSTNLSNTVLAYSPAGGNCSGTLSAATFSLSSDNSCALTGLVHGHDPNSLDPLLTALGNYGGPTRVHMLRLGSPAIAGVVGNAAPTNDQRGQPRPGPDGSFDIGAVERQPGDTDLAPWLWLPLVRR